MAKKKPDHRDAEVILHLYELRREEVMRKSRNALMQWLPRTYEDVIAITKPTHPDNAAWRQVSSYWEMAYGFARHGAVHPELLIESGAEGLFTYAKLEPHLARLRKEISPTMLQNAEWIARKTKTGKLRFALIQKRVADMTAAAKPRE